jgi:hypothetical protein
MEDEWDELLDQASPDDSDTLIENEEEFESIEDMRDRELEQGVEGIYNWDEWN